MMKRDEKFTKSLWKNLFRSRLVLFCCLLFMCTGNVSAKMQYKSLSEKEKDFLIGLYEGTEFDREHLESIFYDKRLKKIKRVARKNVINREHKNHYQSFSKPYSINLAKRFSRKWRTVLLQANKRFKVDREVVVAILLVETGLGNTMGKYQVISVFSSIILENQRKHFWEKSNRKLSKLEQHRSKRLKKKAAWAKKELKALLKIAQKNRNSPYDYKGSYAGAFGLSQFLPSSYLHYGVDGDNSGAVNLYMVPDAVFSVANYLKKNGWKEGLYRTSNKKVIWRYNRSRHYVKTVLTVAKKIRGNKGKKGKVAQNESKKSAVSTNS